MFAISTRLLAEARAILHPRAHLRWLIGGACSGKSTISRALSEQTGIPVYDMDAAVFGRYTFDPTRHPATTAWFTAENPLGWMLARPWEAFDAHYRAADAELLDRLADDLSDRPDEPLLVDGGISHPSVLAQVIPPARIICLQAPDGFSTREWEAAEHRAGMKAAVLALPDGEAMWRRFLDYDRRMIETIGRECREAGIRIVEWRPSTPVRAVAERVAGELWPGP